MTITSPALALASRAVPELSDHALEKHPWLCRAAAQESKVSYRWLWGLHGIKKGLGLSCRCISSSLGLASWAHGPAG